MWVCPCVWCMCLHYVRALSLLGQICRVGLAKVSRRGQGYKQIAKKVDGVFFSVKWLVLTKQTTTITRGALTPPTPPFLPSFSFLLVLIMTLDLVINMYLIQPRLSNMTCLTFMLFTLFCVCCMFVCHSDLNHNLIETIISRHKYVSNKA